LQPGGRRFDPGPLHLIYQCPAVTSLRGFFLAAVKDLTARFDISQPAVSQHLATLRRARLVSERRDGRLVYSGSSQRDCDRSSIGSLHLQGGADAVVGRDRALRGAGGRSAQAPPLYVAERSGVVGPGHRSHLDAHADAIRGHAAGARALRLPADQTRSRSTARAKGGSAWRASVCAKYWRGPLEVHSIPAPALSTQTRAASSRGTSPSSGSLPGLRHTLPARPYHPHSRRLRR
jgi:DNA-binding transcriptional ArsR family regulator